MKRNYDTLNLGSITVRFPIPLLQEIDTKSGPGLKYRDHSDAIRSLVALGLRIESLMEIHADPKKREAFEEKITSLFKEKNVEQMIETMDADQINTIMFFAQNLKDKKIQTIIDDVRTT